MAACLASLLELPLEKVPNFRKDYPAQDFNFAINDWLRRYGLMLLRVRLRNEDGTPCDPFDAIHPLPEGVLCIASGPSPRFANCGHAVVGTIENGFYFKLLHDPNRDGNGLETYWTYDFLVPFNPLQAIYRSNIIE